MKRVKSIVYVLAFAIFLATVSSVCLAKPETKYSEAERRELARFPKLSTETVASGEFSKDFESYTTDQFPARDFLRSIKAAFARIALNKADNNGLFYIEGHISKIDSEENDAMMEHAKTRFDFLYESYLKENPVYFSIVPDKNMFLAEENGYPSLDYRGFIKRMTGKIPYMEYIDITDLLSLDDYYRTDTHWKQEAIRDIAARLASAMGKDTTGEIFTENVLDHPFLGVYAGQYAGKVAPDTIKYLTSERLDRAIVTYYDTGVAKKGSLYNMEKATGKDPYEMFLSGTMPLVTLKDSQPENDNHLILFRDSFGSSIAPLFLGAYSKITVIDTRYVQSEFLKNMVDFKGADVLFLYSTSLLNNSLAIR